MNRFITNIKPHDFQLCAVDTDAIAFCKPDMSAMSEEEIEALLNELNSYMPKLVRFANDGYSDDLIMVKTKNYVSRDKKKTQIKGASLKAPNKEKYLKDFIDVTLKILLNEHWTQDQVITLYNNIAQECINVTDISRFSFKKAYTEAVMNGEGTAELKARLALKYEKGVQQGDKFRMFYLSNSNLSLEKNFNGDYCRKTLLKKLFKTAEIFNTIPQLPISLFINYSLQINYYPLIGEEKPKRAKKLLI